MKNNINNNRSSLRNTVSFVALRKEKSLNHNTMKKIGCTVEHKWTGALAICDKETLKDKNWLFYDKRAVRFE